MPDPPAPPPPSRAYGVVVPVKPTTVAKSRLQPLGDDVRRALVTAFAVDTVVAALACPAVERVLVVTDDVRLARDLRGLGADAVPDGASGSLNASLQQGAAELLRRAPTLRPVALCADLPALRPEELAAALGEAGNAPAAFVPDTSGAGTTMYTAATLDRFHPRFGDDSRSEHVARGALEMLLPDIDSLQRDVDTPDDLRVAAALGLGRHTYRLVTSLRLLDEPPRA